MWATTSRMQEFFEQVMDAGDPVAEFVADERNEIALEGNVVVGEQAGAACSVSSAQQGQYR